MTVTTCCVARSHAPAAGAVASGGTSVARGLDRAGAVGGDPVTVIVDVGDDEAVGGESVMVLPEDVGGVGGGAPVCG